MFSPPERVCITNVLRATIAIKGNRDRIFPGRRSIVTKLHELRLKAHGETDPWTIAIPALERAGFINVEPFKHVESLVCFGELCELLGLRTLMGRQRARKQTMPRRAPAF